VVLTLAWSFCIVLFAVNIEENHVETALPPHDPERAKTSRGDRSSLHSYLWSLSVTRVSSHAGKRHPIYFPGHTPVICNRVQYNGPYFYGQLLKKTKLT